MNKTFLLLIGAIVVVGGFIGYTVLGSSDDIGTHTAGDGHTEAQHAGNTAVPHDDTGSEPHDH